jgi:hypothetical protein
LGVMSTEAEFCIPDDETLCELGRMQVLHSHLDHTLRLAIKRMLDISIDDPGYWNETRGMAADLRRRARDLIGQIYRDDHDTADTLNGVLDDAEEVTLLRNRALHSVWIKRPGQEPMLHDRDNSLKTHVDFTPPAVADLAKISKRIERTQRVLNHLTRKLLKT